MAIRVLHEGQAQAYIKSMQGRTSAEAIEQFEQPYDVIACSVHFNDGQFYDLLRMVKAHPVARNAPFLVHFTGMESKHHYITQSRRASSYLSPLSRSNRLNVSSAHSRCDHRVAFRVEGNGPDVRPVACAA